MNFTELVEIMSSNGVVNLADIARKLEVSPQSVSNWKARNRVPYKYEVEVQNRYQPSHDGNSQAEPSSSAPEPKGVKLSRTYTRQRAASSPKLFGMASY